jgi:16S rRNA U516 pseudouridylate synthase RsuA-like enzyme
LDLKRVAIGNLRDERLGLGKFRRLTEEEVRSLK